MVILAFLAVVIGVSLVLYGWRAAQVGAGPRFWAADEIAAAIDPGHEDGQLHADLLGGEARPRAGGSRTASPKPCTTRPSAGAES